MIKIKDVSIFLESLAPLSTQESYDNCGLIVGDFNTEVKGALVALDCTEEVVSEAIELGYNLIVAHHPIVFKGLKKLNGSNYIERTVIKAIKNDIAIYALHTNFDHYAKGVNYEIGKRLGLKNLKILQPKTEVITKLVTYAPTAYAETVLKALFEAGAGQIGDYAECSFSSVGRGTYKPSDEANPFEGRAGVQSNVEECKLEVVFSQEKTTNILSKLKEVHPYEEVAYELYALMNENQSLGSGMVGELENSMSEAEFLNYIKTNFNVPMIRHTKMLNKVISKVAFCGGSGSFLLSEAKRSGAEIFITSDVKYHDFFDAEDDIVIADIGHFESEQFTSNRISELLTKKFPKFAVRLTGVNTNPINYF